MLLGLATGDSLGIRPKGSFRTRDIQSASMRRIDTLVVVRSAFLPTTPSPPSGPWNISWSTIGSCRNSCSRRSRNSASSVSGALWPRRVRRSANAQPWYQAAQRSAGNGALTRIAPVVAPHLKAPSSALRDFLGALYPCAPFGGIRGGDYSRGERHEGQRYHRSDRRCGRRRGHLAFRSQWVHGLLGRTTEYDDGRVFELIARARERWK
jgi:hypothetical protein